MAEDQSRERERQLHEDYKPDESNRLELAKKWLAVARGKTAEPKN